MKANFFSNFAQLRDGDRIKPSIDSSGLISFRSSLVEQGIDLNELLGSRRLASIEGTDLQLSRRHLQPGTITENV